MALAATSTCVRGGTYRSPTVLAQLAAVQRLCPGGGVTSGLRLAFAASTTAQQTTCRDAARADRPQEIVVDAPNVRCVGSVYYYFRWIFIYLSNNRSSFSWVILTKRQLQLYYMHKSRLRRTVCPPPMYHAQLRGWLRYRKWVDARVSAVAEPRSQRRESFARPVMV